ncbi:MAG: hypothetical protein ACXWE9_05440 [Methylobacter sp.]
MAEEIGKPENQVDLFHHGLDYCNEAIVAYKLGVFVDITILAFCLVKTHVG